MNIHDKSNRNKQKAQPERHSRQARSVQIADHHPTGIRLPSDYPVLPPAANLFIIAGVKVRHGAVAGRLLMGGRA